MARIRTVKPELFRHEELFDLEIDTGLPVRLSFIGLFSCCDREGRFKWRPRSLKLDVLPHDNIDFSRVLDALVTRGFVVKYRASGVDYGCIPSFLTHQSINNRESESTIPPLSGADSVFSAESGENSQKNPINTDEHSINTAEVDASSTRESRVTTLHKGKGREGKGKERKEIIHVATESQSSSGAFDIFWAAGMRKVNKSKAEKSFIRELKNSKMEPMEFANMLATDVKRRLAVSQLGFSEMHPTTYLNGQRWRDELVVKSRGSPNQKPSMSEQLRIDAENNRRFYETGITEDGEQVTQW